jgi:hypothetical protein
MGRLSPPPRPPDPARLRAALHALARHYRAVYEPLSRRSIPDVEIVLRDADRPGRQMTICIATDLPTATPQSDQDERSPPESTQDPPELRIVG